MNLGGLLDRRDDVVPGWGWREDHCELLSAAGFTLVRLPVRWWGRAQQAAPHRLDPAFEQRVRSVVQAVLEHGLDVVVSMHHADGLTCGAAGAQARLCDLWRQITADFAGLGRGAGADGDAVLAFELLNEPQGAMSPQRWNTVLPQVLAAVREVDPERTVVVGGAHASTLPGLLALQLPDDAHLVATLHHYEPFTFTHQGASWEAGSASWQGSQWGSEEDHAAVRQGLEAAAAWVQQRSVPLLVGEFGTYQGAGQASRVRWTRWVRTECERLGLGWVYWDFATDFGAYDLPSQRWHPDLLAALTH